MGSIYLLFTLKQQIIMSYKKTMIGFAADAAIGALAGILFAPQKGSKTRKDIADKAGELTDSVKSSFGNMIDGFKNMYSSDSQDTPLTKEVKASKEHSLS